jgi:hypothetical protein
LSDAAKIAESVGVYLNGCYPLSTPIWMAPNAPPPCSVSAATIPRFTAALEGGGSGAFDSGFPGGPGRASPPFRSPGKAPLVPCGRA